MSNSPDRSWCYLRHAGELADTIARMKVDVAEAPTIVNGYNKQPVANPLLAEIRMHRQLRVRCWPG